MAISVLPPTPAAVFMKVCWSFWWWWSFALNARHKIIDIQMVISGLFAVEHISHAVNGDHPSCFVSYVIQLHIYIVYI